MTDNIHHAIVKKQKAPTILWVLPLIALLLTGFLAFKQYSEKGIDISIHFNDGAGIIPEETTLRYKGISIGTVVSATVEEDLSGVVAVIAVEKKSAHLIRPDTTFWVVEPILSLSNISGLDTLISGKYIALQNPPASKQDKNKGFSLGGLKLEKFSFNALPAPPTSSQLEGGISLLLQTSNSKSLNKGSPVLYKNLEVGEIEDISFSSDQKNIMVGIHIEEKYSHLVEADTVFWQNSGVNIQGNLNEINIQLESLTTVLRGGISFDKISPTDKQQPAAETQEVHGINNGDVFTLFDDYDAATNPQKFFVTLSSEQLGSLDKGSPVYYKKVQIGRVDSYQLSDDFSQVFIKLAIKQQYQGLINRDTLFWNNSGISVEGNLNGFTVKSESFTSILRGGISISYLKPSSKKNQFKETDVFILYLDHASANGHPDQHFTLKTDSLGSIDKGTPVFYKKIQVGKVSNYRLSAHDNSIYIDIAVADKYKRLINRETVFWNVSGISVSGGLTNGLEVKVESLMSIARGGIAFSSPSFSEQDKASAKNHVFTLYHDQQSAIDPGIVIKVAFASGEGINKNTPVRYQGIDIGKVIKVDIQDKLQGVVASLRLSKKAGKLTRQGAAFWLVKAQLSLSKAENLDTLIGGKYIAASPGSGKHLDFFTATDHPEKPQLPNEGLNLVLQAEQQPSLKAGSLVFYRNIPVGSVNHVSLAKNSRHVLISINIEQQYTALVRENSQFWNSSGITIDFNLISGAKIQANSVESIVAGGVSFATPDNDEMGALVKSQHHFTLHNEPQEEWQLWAPEIQLP